MRQKLIVGGVSSTELRKRAREARKLVSPKESSAAMYGNIAGLTTKGVIDYIVKNRLYI